MDKSRNRYDLYRKYKKSSSPKETSPISRVTFHHELIENTHANDDTLVRNQDDDATHAKNKMRSRFQNILTFNTYSGINKFVFFPKSLTERDGQV